MPFKWQNLERKHLMNNNQELLRPKVVNQINVRFEKNSISICIFFVCVGEC